MSNFGVKSMGVKCPIIKEGDDIVKTVVDSVIAATDGKLNDNDVIGVTESVVARSAGLYVTVDEIAEDIRKKFETNRGKYKGITVLHPIYSRNRFSMILKAIARAAEDFVIIYMPEFDEVGNPSGVNPFTGVDIAAYYREIVEGEGKHCVIYKEAYKALSGNVIYCGLHDYEEWKGKYGKIGTFITLADICADKNPDFGLLGTNKATEERIKLFPTVSLANEVSDSIQAAIKERTGKEVNVLVYGDGCFKSPGIQGVIGSSIWELADPTTCPGSTHGILDAKPNEIKIKAFADDKYKDLTGEELDKAVKAEIKTKDKNLVGNMNSQGTTPRRYYDLLASLMDLTSGSGDKGTPVVLVQNYFNNYSD